MVVLNKVQQKNLLILFQAFLSLNLNVLLEELSLYMAHIFFQLPYELMYPDPYNLNILIPQNH